MAKSGNERETEGAKEGQREGESIVYASEPGREGEAPDLRFLHYNDVYHIEAGSRDPVGGIARFQTVCDYYRNDPAFEGQSKLITLFSGDAFNPSLESSVTKGSHMVPFLNGIGTDVACLGNHDLDFGILQFQHLASQCTFPWLLSNVLDPALGPDIPLGNLSKTLLLTSTNGIKIGIIGLVEREWLETINSLPPNLIYKSASATAKELVPGLREQGAEIIIAVTHEREPNDVKLAKDTGGGLIDLIVGGHDHFYSHDIINGVHLLRSGTDFKQLSYIQAWKKKPNSTTNPISSSTSNWTFTITRRDILRSIPECPTVLSHVSTVSSSLQSKMQKPIGYTAAPLDARFTTVRMKESNLGNWVCDLMRLYYGAECALIGGGTIRGDQVYPPGVFRIKDLLNCFPFEDPCVVLRLTGRAILDALENSVSTYPALEGRFPQVSNINITFDPEAAPNHRIMKAEIAGEPIDKEKLYKLVTRGYMAHGKDGYHSLLMQSEGGKAEELVSEENGMLISAIIRQYFMSLKVLEGWKRWCGRGMSPHWATVHNDLHDIHPVREVARASQQSSTGDAAVSASATAPTTVNTTGSTVTVIASDQTITPNDGHHSHHHQQHQSIDSKRKGGTEINGAVVDSDSEDERNHDACLITGNNATSGAKSATQPEKKEKELRLIRKVVRKWWRIVGITGHPQLMETEQEEEFGVDWTKGIAPRVEGRIRMIGS